MANTLKFGNGEWYGKKDTILAYNDENSNYKPLPFDFSRASSATVINKDGLIETVGSGQPRIDYKDDSKGALLLEPQRSNILNYSEPISSETSAGGITYESFNWNLGFTNCIKFGDNSQTRYRYFTGTIANSTEYVISAFVIMDDLSEPVLGTASSNGDLIFRVGGVSATTGNLPNVNMGNSIYRVSSVITSGASGGTTGLIKYAGQSNKGFRVVGFQLEQGSYATSYIPTQGSAVTRLADSCSQTTPDGVIGQTEGTMYAEYYFDATIDNNGGSDRGIVSISNTLSNYIKIVHYGNGSLSYNRKIYLYSIVGGSNVATIISGQYSSGLMKVACGYKNNDYVLYVNGVQIGTDTSASVPTCSLFKLGKLASNINTSTPINQTKLYNTRLSNSELQALTS